MRSASKARYREKGDVYSARAEHVYPCARHSACPTYYRVSAAPEPALQQAALADSASRQGPAIHCPVCKHASRAKASVNVADSCCASVPGRSAGCPMVAHSSPRANIGITSRTPQEQQDRCPCYKRCQCSPPPPRSCTPQLRSYRGRRRLGRHTLLGVLCSRRRLGGLEHGVWRGDGQVGGGRLAAAGAHVE